MGSCAKDDYLSSSYGPLTPTPHLRTDRVGAMSILRVPKSRACELKQANMRMKAKSGTGEQKARLPGHSTLRSEPEDGKTRPGGGAVPSPLVDASTCMPKKHFELSTSQSKLLVAPKGPCVPPACPISAGHTYILCCSNRNQGALLDTSFSSACPSRPGCQPPSNIHGGRLLPPAAHSVTPVNPRTTPATGGRGSCLGAFAPVNSRACETFPRALSDCVTPSVLGNANPRGSLGPLC